MKTLIPSKLTEINVEKLLKDFQSFCKTFLKYDFEDLGIFWEYIQATAVF